MLIGGEIGLSCQQRIDQRDLWQVAAGSISKEARDRFEVDRLLSTELARLRNIAEVIDPGYSRRVELIQDGARDRLVAACWRHDFIGGQIAERSCRQQIKAVGNRRADHAAMVLVVDRES